MKELDIKRELNEETRKQDVVIAGEVYSLHITENEVVVTDNYDYKKIYQITSKEFWNKLDED